MNKYWVRMWLIWKIWLWEWDQDQFSSVVSLAKHILSCPINSHYLSYLIQYTVGQRGKTIPQWEANLRSARSGGCTARTARATQCMEQRQRHSVSRAKLVQCVKQCNSNSNLKEGSGINQSISLFPWLIKCYWYEQEEPEDLAQDDTDFVNWQLTLTERGTGSEEFSCPP